MCFYPQELSVMRLFADLLSRSVVMESKESLWNVYCYDLMPCFETWETAEMSVNTQHLCSRICDVLSRFIQDTSSDIFAFTASQVMLCNYGIFSAWNSKNSNNSSQYTRDDRRGNEEIEHPQFNLLCSSHFKGKTLLTFTLISLEPCALIQSESNLFLDRRHKPLRLKEFLW